MAVDTNMRVLIVDDYKTMLRIMRNLLKQLNFNNVDEAIDGTEALGKLRDDEGDFGLVISDWNMEPMTGMPTNFAGALMSPARFFPPFLLSIVFSRDVVDLSGDAFSYRSVCRMALLTAASGAPG